MERISSIRGMKDLFGADWNKYQFIVDSAVNVAERYGYRMIETPIVENLSVFQRSIGDETDVVSKEMYAFRDKGDELIALRPEGTAGVLRAIVSNNLVISSNIPLKLMYYGPMFRYDRPQKGRYRQFHQLGFEQLGVKHPYTDAITIELASKILNKLGLFDFKVYINSLGNTESRSNYVRILVDYFSKYKNDLSEDSKVRLEKNPLRILDSKDEVDKEIAINAPKINEYLSNEDRKYFDSVCDVLSQYGISFEIDPLLVRGLDYYSQTTFEIKSSIGDFRDAIGGGGRYDNLLKMFGGQDISGIGFAFGIERLMLLIDDIQKQENKIGVIPVTDTELNEALRLFKELQDNDISSELILVNGSLRKKVEVGTKMNCQILLIIGEDEIKNNQVQVTRINTEKDRNKAIDRNNIINYIKYVHNL